MGSMRGEGVKFTPGSMIRREVGVFRREKAWLGRTVQVLWCRNGTGIAHYFNRGQEDIVGHVRVWGMWGEPVMGVTDVGSLAKSREFGLLEGWGTGSINEAMEEGLKALRSGLFEEAGECFERILSEGEGGNSEVHLHLAEARLYQGRFDEVERICRLLVDSDPRRPEVRALLGLAMVHLGREDEALGYLAKAPEHPAVLMGQAMAFERLERLVEAEQAVRRALRLCPEGVEIRRYLGSLLAMQRRYGEALKEWERVLKLDPANEAAREARAEVLEILGNGPAVR